MSQVLPSYPDGEDVMMAIVEPLVSSPDRVVQSTPPDFVVTEPDGPLIRVRQTTGTSGKLDTRPVIEVACFAATYTAAKALAAQAEQRVLATRATTVPNVTGHPGGVYVDKTEVIASPREVSYEDPEKRRKTASYRLVMRRPRT